METPGYTIPSEAADGAAKIAFARVDRVNIPEYTVDVTTEFTHRNITDVPFSSPFCAPDHGGGINFMPEVGAYCHVCLCADGTKFVFAWVLTPNTVTRSVLNEDGSVTQNADEPGPDFSGNRDELEPGDVYLGTRDGNRVMVRRGGMVVVKSGPLCQTVYIPIENAIRQLFQRKEELSPLGEVVWDHSPLSDEEGESDTSALYRFKFKKKAEEDVSGGHFTVEVCAGDLSERMLDASKDSEHLFFNDSLRALNGSGSGLTSGPGVVSMIIYSHEAGAKAFAFQLNQGGDGFLSFNSSVHIEVKNKLFLEVGSSAEIKFGRSGTMTLDASLSQLRTVVRSMVHQVLNELLITAGSLTVTTGSTTFSLSGGGGSLKGGNLSIGNGGDPVVVDRNQLLQLIAQHSHPIVEGVAIMSQELANITSSKSSRLKAE